MLGWPGDNFEYVWKMWWTAHALGQGASPFFNPDMYVPAGFDLAHAELTPANTFLFLPVTALLGPVVAYNTAVVLSFVLSGLAARELVIRLTGDRLAGLVAGAAFAFCSFRIAHLPGHLPLLATWPIPLAFLWLERALRDRSARSGASAGLFWALTALGSWYLGYALALALLVYTLARLSGPSLDPQPSALNPWSRPLLAFAAVAFALVTPFAWPYLALAGQGGLKHSIESADYWSGGLAALVVPNPMHPLWGPLLPDLFRAEFVERLIYLGAVPLALAAVAFRGGLDRVGRAFAAVALVSVVLALGTTLRIAGPDPVLVPVGGELSGRFYRAYSWLTEHSPFYGLPRGPIEPGMVNVPMPAVVPYLALPMFSSMRNLGRLVLVAMLALAVLAGFGFARLRIAGAPRAALALLLVGLSVFETDIPYQLSPTAPRAADLWLARAERRPLAHFPLGEAISGPAEYYTIHHRQPVIFGYGTHIQSGFRQLMPRLGQFPSGESLDVLRRLGVGWVTVHPDAYGAEWAAVAQRIEETPALRLATELDGIRIYELR